MDRAALTNNQASADELRRRLLGVDFSDVQVKRVLGAGCNGAVFVALVHGSLVALKVMYNFGAETTMVGNLFKTEYRFLRIVPHHPNIVSVLGVIKAAPLTPDIVALLPEAARDAAAPRSRRGRVRFLPTAGMFMELLPRTLEAHLDARGADLTQAEAVSIGAQVASAVNHLYAHGVVHGDIKLNNLMVDVDEAGADACAAAAAAAAAAAGGGGGGGGGAAGDCDAAAAAASVRVVLVDFGCAAAQGPGRADMDDQMRVLATEATNFALGNQSHLAPEVLDAMARIHPLPGYPTIVGDVASVFDRIEFDDVRELAGTEYTDIVRGLLQFEPQARLSVDDACHRLAALRVRLCPPPVNGPAHDDVGVDVGERLPPVGDRGLEARQAATIAALQAALEEQRRVAAQQAEDQAARLREAQAAPQLQAAAVEEQRIAAREEEPEAREARERVAEQALGRSPAKEEETRAASLKECGRITVWSVRQLRLNGKGLRGSIPTEIGQLVQLTELSLDENQLTGPIPKQIGQLVQLTWLNLYRNQLTDPAGFEQFMNQKVPGALVLI